MTTPDPPRNYSVVIPAFDEETGIGDVLEEINRTLGLDREGVEVIVVDDGSRDRTAAEAEKYGARVLRHPINVGYGAAILTGVRVAK